MKKSVQLIVPMVMLCFASVTVAIEGTITWNPQTKQCAFNSGNPNPNHSQETGLDPGEYMVWNAGNLPDGTRLEFYFIKKMVAGRQGKGESPFADKKRFFDAVVAGQIKKVTRGPVRTGVADSFSYKITCYVPGEERSVVDPMIDVPKIRIATETQTTTSN